MNNKGFTLVELLAVLVILAIIVSIAVQSTISISNKIQKNMYCEKIKSIETAATMYGEDERENFTDTYRADGQNYLSQVVKVSDLVNKNYLKKDQNSSPFIVDPRDKNSTDLYNMDLTVYIKYNRIYVHFNEQVNTTCAK